MTPTQQPSQWAMEAAREIDPYTCRLSQVAEIIDAHAKPLSDELERAKAEIVTLNGIISGNDRDHDRSEEVMALKLELTQLRAQLATEREAGDALVKLTENMKLCEQHGGSCSEYACRDCTAQLRWETEVHNAALAYQAARKEQG